jgi:hypothetical protein
MMSVGTADGGSLSAKTAGMCRCCGQGDGLRHAGVGMLPWVVPVVFPFVLLLVFPLMLLLMLLLAVLWVVLLVVLEEHLSVPLFL